ncbi:MAG TPA: Gldg family protein [Pirellulales bacterium]|nr:Gldg family protein [Pirellulales bacterium]
MNANVISAIFRRNFYSYFSNPTGYVFICVYVLLSSFAAFWPNEFFNSNLANLDQLNRYLPYIMLVFIPAITMSVWAEERRQGTDELLLTIPAADFDVVLGKYLAAVAIYSVALAFSMICALSVLLWLGKPDPGLFLGTYFGYWMVGVAMLAVGMVASFLTGNLTVGFVLGAVFNAPLAFAANADVILPADWAIPVKQWSLEEQFRDFGRGVVSLSGVAYFGLIVVVMLYLSMVLIGRRHWQGGRDGHSLGGHYLIRALSLIALAVGLVLAFERFDVRADVTYERLGSLSRNTKTLLKGLKRTVKIDAYISPEVPESFVQTRLDLLSALREMAARGGSKITLRVHDTEPLSKEAEQAEQQFGITAQQVISRTRGAISREQVYLGVACTSGLEKVVVPFFGPAVPVEYELVRSIATASEESRKKLGVLVTDAKLYGSFNMQTFSMSPNEKLIDELEKQYEVVQVNADTPVPDDVDVLFAVQPSSLSPEQMKNFIAAVRRGIPTAVFEDPFPWTRRDVPGTSAPKRPPQNPMNPFGGGQPPLPKGNISELWNLLGVDFPPAELIWQNYNAYPKFQAIWTPDWVYIDNVAWGDDPKPSREKPFNQDDPITAGLQQVLMLYPGAISHLNASRLKFEPLLTTGSRTGTVSSSELEQPSMFGGGGELNPNPRRKPTLDNYTLAAHITGNLDDEQLDDEEEESTEGTSDADQKETGQKDSKEPADEKKPARQKGSVDVVLVTDIDMLHSEFFQLRPMQSRDPDQDFSMSLDNVTFVLNVLDELAGDDRFIDIRKRRPQHRTLETIEETTKESRREADEKKRKFREGFEEARSKEQKQLDEKVEEIREKDIPALEKAQLLALAQQSGQQRLAAAVSQLEKKRDREVTRIERELNLEITRVQDWYKMWSVVLPPLLPMLVGLAVFFNRRAREREGVSRNRLR